MAKKTITVSERDRMIIGEPEMGWWRRYKISQGNMMPGLNLVQEVIDAMSVIFSTDIPLVTSLTSARERIVVSKLEAEAEILSLQEWFVDMLQDYTPRRPLYEDRPDGYVTSDKDHVVENTDICVQFLKMLEEMLEVEE